MANLRKRYCARGHARTTENLTARRGCKLCSRISNRKYRKNHPDKTIRNMFTTLKVHARRRGLSVGLSFEIFCSIHKKTCIYCGGVLPKKGYGIDRKDSTKGYTRSNSVPCCSICNRAKSDMSTVQFKQWIERLKSFV